MEYDAIIIGTGQAGPQLAGAFAGMGQKVAVAEGAQMGGSCVNYGCTPTKTMRASARIAHLARRAADYGINAGLVSVDFGAVMRRKEQVVSASRDGLEKWLAGEENIDIYRDYASFAGRENGHYCVQVGDKTIEAPRVYLNTGTRPFIPPVDGIDTVPYLDNISLMHLEELPEHLVILGGGYIGLEMGQIMRRFGSRVTIIEYGPHVAGREDTDISEAIEDFLKAEGVDILTGHKAVSAAYNDGQVTLTTQTDDGQTTGVRGSHLLVAVGRIPNTDRLNLDAVGVRTDKRGYIPVDKHLRTNVDGIWALGDINGEGAFTHTSYQDHEIVLDNYKGGTRSLHERIMAYAMFTDPPLGRVGLTEKDVRNSGKEALISVFRMANVSRAKEDGETTGMIKVLVDAETEQFLGAAILGIHGDEIIQAISNFMYTEASYKVMQKALPIHPTVTEFMPTILKRLKPLE